MLNITLINLSLKGITPHDPSRPVSQFPIRGVIPRLPLEVLPPTLCVTVYDVYRPSLFFRGWKG